MLRGATVSRWGRSSTRLWPLLAAAALCVAFGWLSVDAAAVPPHGGTKGSKSPPAAEKAGPPAPKDSQGKSQAEKSKGTEVFEKQSALEPLDPVAEELGGSGQVDPITGLGLRNPVCDKPGQIRSTQTRLSCIENGTPEGKYPSSNYGFDVFIDSGIDAPSGNFAKALVMILNGIWLGLIFVLKLVLALLGLAFGLNPFSDGDSMHEIAAALDRIYRTITDPWLSVVIVAGGIWFAYKGLLRRELAAGVGGTLAGVAMLIVGLWVIHQPAASVGRLGKISDEVAVTAISAPRSGSLARPTGTYAEALSHTWAQLVEVPFAGLNFSDVNWAMGPPPKEAVERANEHFCEDAGALALIAAQEGTDSNASAKACEQFAQKRYGKPRRVIDLYLRSSPGSPARADLWDYFDKDEADKYKAKVAAQGGDGVLTRLSMLVLFSLGLIGAVMLLAWLALRLFTQAAIAFVLLLAAPFAVFFPLLGESGRRAFKTWGLTLIGATVAKIVYAAFLSVVLLGMTILGKVGDATGFLLACAFAWAVFLKRIELIGWMSVGDVEGGRNVSPIAQFLAWSGARRMTRTATGTVRGIGSRGAHNWRQRFGSRNEELSQRAKGRIESSARRMSDPRIDAARAPVSGPEANRAGAPQNRQAPGGGSTSSAAPRADHRGTSAAHAAAKSFERTERYMTAAEATGMQLGGHGSDKDTKKPGAEGAPRSQPKSSAPQNSVNLRHAAREKARDKERQDPGRDLAKPEAQGQDQRKVPSQIPGRVVGRSGQGKKWTSQPREGAPQTPNPPRLAHRRIRRPERAPAHRRGISRKKD
jgi:hypothetical protein